jgi:hypothetical protein
MQFLHTHIKIAHLFLFWLLCLPSLSDADIVILKSGDKYETDRIWEESGQVKFKNRNHLMSVPKHQVEHIFKTTSPRPATKDTRRHPPGDENPRSMIANAAAQANPSTTKPPRSVGHTAEDAIQDLIFEGVRWGLAPGDIEGLTYSDRDPAYGGVAQYYRPDEDLKMGRADLRGVLYGFWRDQLYTITAWADGIANYRKMRKKIFKHLGKGSQRLSGVERYTWIDEDSDMMLEFDVDLNIGLFWMRSRMVDRQVKKHYPE